MGRHLYIIGNGFDIHHGINSKYTDFSKWLEEANYDLFYRIYEAYNLYEIELYEVKDVNEWWCNFEKQLALLDAINYSAEIASEHAPDLMSDHCDSTWNEAAIEVENKLGGLFNELRDSFHDWIEQLDKPLGCRMVNMETHDSYFITFNYTLTLENLYGINPQRILHIHGCVNYDEEFILGHGKSFEELEEQNRIKIPVPPPNITDDELSQFYESCYGNELHEQLAIGAAIRGIASQKKPVLEIIQKYKSYFDSIKDIECIHVYGLSLSDIDLPYLKYFADKFKTIEWEFSYYESKDLDNNDLDNIESFCVKNGIQNYSKLKLIDIMIAKQLTMEFSA